MKTGYLPYVIYTNVLEFVKYRQLKMISEVLEEKKYIEKIQIDGYIIIELEDLADKKRRYTKNIDENAKKLKTKSYIIIVEPNNVASLVSAHFEKMLKTIPEFTTNKRKCNLEIMIITKEIFKANINNKIETFVSPGDITNGFITIHNYPYKNFIIVIPKHILVPKHRLLSEEEENMVLAEAYTKKRDIPKLAKTDPTVVWYGGISGDVFEILVPSEAVGTEVHYRCVI